jgi:2-polyprenyl-3-methyl-5-hydroxy-6-metoxy-1,4-benzoquinol methylase
MIQEEISTLGLEIDWYKHYEEKLNTLDFTIDDLEKFHDQHRALIDAILQRKPKHVLEAGCGLCRDSMVLSHAGIEVTALDKDERILKIAKKNCNRMGLALNFLCEDFFHLRRSTLNHHYDLVFHSGVLEHFHDWEIHAILEQQLAVAPQVIFSVPLASDSNHSYFDDGHFRRLIFQEDWLEILGRFSVEKAEIVTGRHDDLLVVLKRSE